MEVDGHITQACNNYLHGKKEKSIKEIEIFEKVEEVEEENISVLAAQP